MRESEDMKFWAVWNLDCRGTPRLRSSIGAQQDRHTIMIVDKPLGDRFKEDQGYLGAFWVYLDGFNAYTYVRETSVEVQGLCHFPAPAYAPEEERFLLTLSAAHHQYPKQVERSFPRTLRIEQGDELVHEGSLWLRVPPSPNGWVMHPYVQRVMKWRVTLGEESCAVVCCVYTLDAFWFGGQCWQERIENWCFMLAGEEAIEVYSRPGRMQMGPGGK